jgi:uncharacterized Zn finger protein (UPF0148 family)
VEKLEVLRCSSCSAPLVLGDTDAITCPACGTNNPVPEAYRDLRRARHDDPAVRAKAEAVLRKLDNPPSMVVKVLAKCLDLPMLAFAMIYGIPVAMIAILNADRFDTWLAPRLHVKVDDVPFGYMVAMMFGILLVMAFIPRAFGVYANRRVADRSRLLGALSARQPKVAGAAAECRGCGAPLAVAPNAIVSMCGYCGTENAVKVETSVAESAKSVVKNLGTTMADAAKQDRAERRATLKLLGKELFRYVFRTVVLGVLFVLGSQEKRDPDSILDPGPHSTTLGIVSLCAFLLMVFVFIFRSGKYAKTDDGKERREGNDVPDWVGWVGPLVIAYLLFKFFPRLVF